MAKTVHILLGENSRWIMLSNLFCSWKSVILFGKIGLFEAWFILGELNLKEEFNLKFFWLSFCL